MIIQHEIERKLILSDKIKIRYSDRDYVGESRQMENGEYFREG